MTKYRAWGRFDAFGGDAFGGDAFEGDAFEGDAFEGDAFGGDAFGGDAFGGMSGGGLVRRVGRPVAERAAARGCGLPGWPAIRSRAGGGDAA
ncbi:hypothetical protein Ari01nite_20410 [Paractinoplanes rishiriensis]|uniref:Uncharacterized protein n=1 Tax=Paractinoplanes rishiriensis TaxID=1050105 RepID=A0A919JSW9_9ACTN|nr:hypothetical protein Ari01nite_20410 [Actinoplanes rishiriensis]